MSDEFDDENSEIEHLQQELDDLVDEKNALFLEAILDAGLDPDDPELNDKLGDMDPNEVCSILPDTSWQDERIEEIEGKINEIKSENDPEE